jgi:hypothetical protein
VGASAARNSEAACGQHDGQTHLEQPQPEHMAAHGAQLGQVEFQADHEHQEHHAKLTQVLDALGVLRQRQRVGADQHAHHQVAQHGRQLHRPARHHPQHGGQQVKQRQFQRGHPPMLASQYRVQ